MAPDDPSDPDWHVRNGVAFGGLPGEPSSTYPAGVPFRTVLASGTMTVEAFAPEGEDLQQPHDQDELYVVVAGRSDFDRGDETVSCAAGDVIFVPAGMQHRFVRFSVDFRTWVIFWGPPGGEPPRTW